MKNLILLSILKVFFLPLTYGGVEVNYGLRVIAREPVISDETSLRETINLAAQGSASALYHLGMFFPGIKLNPTPERLYALGNMERELLKQAIQIISPEIINVEDFSNEITDLSVRFFFMASIQGHTEAMLQLGHYLYSGSYNPETKNSLRRFIYSKSRLYDRLSAEEQVRFLNQDLKHLRHGFYWYLQAAARGHEVAYRMVIDILNDALPQRPLLVSFHDSYGHKDEYYTLQKPNTLPFTQTVQNSAIIRKKRLKQLANNIIQEYNELYRDVLNSLTLDWPLFSSRLPRVRLINKTEKLITFVKPRARQGSKRNVASQSLNNQARTKKCEYAFQPVIFP